MVPLYPDTIPNRKPTADQEFADERGIVYRVSRPTLTVFLPPDSVANGTAVIICPGGGYRALVMEREGVQVAKAFNERGVAVFVLKYRLPCTCTPTVGTASTRAARKTIGLRSAYAGWLEPQ